MIRAGYELLHLLTFFTVGPKEARAWTVHGGAKAPAGGGRDPHRFRDAASSAPRRSPSTTTSRWAAKPARAMPASCAPEGKEYVVQDGDVMLFRFNV